MEKLLGILPYIYFFNEPIQLGNVTFIGVPASQGKSLTPMEESDRKCLQELSACFPTSHGLKTDKGVVKAITYFLLDNTKNNDEEALKSAQKAITLLRYALLRPDSQAFDNIESTYLYTFALPPVSHGEYPLYQCWPNLNQEIWISPKHQKFPAPGWDVDIQVVHTSKLEDMQQIRECFYTQRMSDQIEAEVLLAMEWYNQSFQKYSIRNIAGHVVDISIAFETLFQLPRHNKTAEFKNRIREYLHVQEGSVLDNWANDFYSNIRSETVHEGKPLSYLFKHPEAQTPHLSFLYSARRVFRECVASKAGLPRHISNDTVLEELTPNEVHLNDLKEAGSFEDIRKRGLLQKVEKLRPMYPAGKQEDIIWLGKELLRDYKEQFMTADQSLPTLDLILDAEDNDRKLGLKYYQLSKEFSSIYFRYTKCIDIGHGEANEEELRKPEPVPLDNLEQRQLESAIYHFTRFAGWALLFPP